MSGCGGSCGDCKSASECVPAPENKGRYVSPDPDISTYLAPFPKPAEDPTSLDEPCNCNECFDIPRSACLTCIRSWVFAVCKCTAEKALETYKDNVILVDRLQMIIEEKKRKARINDTGYLDHGCRNCSCTLSCKG